MEFREAIRSFEGQPITRQILEGLLKNYKRPGDRITDLIKQGVLTQLKSKIYIPGPALKMRGPEPFLLANHLAGPSYVSMETALSHWHIIPERVYEISSATTGRSKIFSAAVNRYSYIHLPLPYFSFGQRSVEVATRQVAIIATPEKALCDTIIATSALLFRSTKQVKPWLLDDMRMDRDELRKLRPAIIRDWLPNAPKKESLEWLVKTLEEL